MKNLAMKQKPKKAKAVLNVKGVEYELVGKKLVGKELVGKELVDKELVGKKLVGKKVVAKKITRKKGGENRDVEDMYIENNNEGAEEEKENLDERGYKTVMRPAVSYDEDTR